MRDYEAGKASTCELAAQSANAAEMVHSVKDNRGQGLVVR